MPFEPFRRLLVNCTSMRTRRRLRHRYLAIKNRSMRHAIGIRMRRHVNDGYLAIEIHNKLGLGAKLCFSLFIIAYCEDNGLVPRFRFSSPIFSDDDIFSHLFSIRNDMPMTPDTPFIVVTKSEHMPFFDKHNADRTISHYSKLLHKYVSVKPDVMRDVRAFDEVNFNSKAVLGVHYRGTDKFTEAPPVSYDLVRRNILYYADRFPNTKTLFIASDDQMFVDFIVPRIPNLRVVHHEGLCRSRDQSPLHLNVERDHFKVSRDALIDMLLLARCDVLMKTSSFLSSMAVIFNPSIPVIMLNTPIHGHWFPESEIMANVLCDPVG